MTFSLICFNLWIVLRAAKASCVHATRPCSTVLPLVGCPPSQVGKCVRLGATAPLVGATKWIEEGNATRMGLQLFAQAWNQRELKGAQRLFVEMFLHNDEGSVSVAKEKYESMVNHTDYFIGPFSSSMTRNVQAVAKSKGRLLVAHMAAAESVYKQGNDLLFGVITTAKHYTASAVHLLALRGVKTMSILKSANPFASEVARGLEMHALDRNITVTFNHQYTVISKYGPSDPAQFPDLVDAACVKNAEAMFIIGQLEDAEPIVKAAHSNPACRPNALFMTSAPANANWVADNLMAANSFALLGPSQWQEHEKYSDKLFGSSEDFSDALMKQEDLTHGGVPSYIAAAAATAGLALMTAIDRTFGGEVLPSQQEVAGALRSFGPLHTFFGPVQFKSCTAQEFADGAECGHNYIKPMITTQVQEGNIKVVAPIGQAEVEFIYPAPVARAAGDKEQDEFLVSCSEFPASPGTIFLSLCSLLLVWF